MDGSSWHCTRGTDQEKKKKYKKAKWLSEELRKEEKQKAKEKGKLYPFECRVSKNSKER